MPLSSIAEAVIAGYGSGELKVDLERPCADAPFVFDVTKLRSVVGEDPAPLGSEQIQRALSDCGKMLRSYQGS